MYYKISSRTDDDGMMQGFTFDIRAVKKIKFDYGQRLHPASHETAGPREKEPTEVIKLNLERSKAVPLPSYLSQPVPLMSKQLLETLRTAGVDNLDAYPADLYYPDGKLAPGEFFIVNVVGLIAAADLNKSKFDPEQPDKMIAMGFDSLAIDRDKTKGALMFRLAESIVTVLVHEKVVKAVEAANIPLIRFYKTEDIAII